MISDQDQVQAIYLNRSGADHSCEIEALKIFQDQIKISPPESELRLRSRKDQEIDFWLRSCLIEGALVREAVQPEDERRNAELGDDEGVAEGVPGEPHQLAAHDAAKAESRADPRQEPEEELGGKSIAFFDPFNSTNIGLKTDPNCHLKRMHA